MARDHARIRLDIWADDDFGSLTSSAQWLYLHLLSSPTLSFAGVADWRPARIAGRTAELTAADVEFFATELERDHYVLIDRRTEEALIRSWVKHDGLMKSPNMAKALVKAYGATASQTLRAVIVGQLHRLHEAKPELKGWTNAATLLGRDALTPAEALEELPPNPSGNPSANPSGNPSENQAESDGGNPSVTPYSILHTPDSFPSSVTYSTSPGEQPKAANG